MNSLENELKKCATVGEMLDVVNNRYQLHSVRPGLIQKVVIVETLVKAVKFLNLKEP
jgi:hypothetical protein